MTARRASGRRERAVFDQEIDDEPTELLLERPVHPVDDSWAKARRVQLTGFWRPAGLGRLAHHAGGPPEARLCLASGIGVLT